MCVDVCVERENIELECVLMYVASRIAKQKFIAPQFASVVVELLLKRMPSEVINLPCHQRNAAAVTH